MIIHDVAQRTAEWYSLRMGKPTTSEFSRIVTSTGERSKQMQEYATHLAAELYVGRPLDMWSGNDWAERGRVLEDQAISLYEFANEVEVRKVGFITDDQQRWGTSPDGLVGDDGMIEIKCLKHTHHISAILRYKAKGTCPTDYVQQTQGQIFVTGRKWVDLIFYSPEFPLLTIRQIASEQLQQGLADGLPALMTERDQILETLKSLNV